MMQEFLHFDGGHFRNETASCKAQRGCLIFVIETLPALFYKFCFRINICKKYI